jgi:hypothetical protein
MAARPCRISFQDIASRCQAAWLNADAEPDLRSVSRHHRGKMPRYYRGFRFGFSIILNAIQGIILGTFLFLPLGDAA